MINYGHSTIKHVCVQESFRIYWGLYMILLKSQTIRLCTWQQRRSFCSRCRFIFRAGCNGVISLRRGAEHWTLNVKTETLQESWYLCQVDQFWMESWWPDWLSLAEQRHRTPLLILGHSTGWVHYFKWASGYSLYQ